MVANILGTLNTEDYSSGQRGSPAKGVGRVTGARVRISCPPPKNRLAFASLFFLSKPQAWHIIRHRRYIIKGDLSPLYLITP